MLNIAIGKGIELPVDTSRLNREVMDHVVRIGLRNILMDSHASATAKAYPDDYVAKSRELAEKKLESMYAGIVRVQSAGNGIKTPTDPIALVIVNRRPKLTPDRRPILTPLSDGL